MTSTRGREIHGREEQARESGDFLDALRLSDEAMLAYQEDGDDAGFAEIHAARFLILRHLFEKTNYKPYLILAKFSAMSSVEIAEHSGDKTALAIPYQNLAKIEEDLEEYKDAIDNYTKSLEHLEKYPPATHNRPGVVADFKIHLHLCELRSGDKSALPKLEEAIEELKNSGEKEVSDYNFNVWLSGAYMKMAEILAKDNPEKAKVALQKSKEIIDSDERLKLRLGQWQKIADKIK